MSQQLAATQHLHCSALHARARLNTHVHKARPRGVPGALEIAHTDLGAGCIDKVHAGLSTQYTRQHIMRPGP
jgi:hypothetical protein